MIFVRVKYFFIDYVFWNNVLDVMYLIKFYYIDGIVVDYDFILGYFRGICGNFLLNWGLVSCV